MPHSQLINVDDLDKSSIGYGLDSREYSHGKVRHFRTDVAKPLNFNLLNRHRCMNEYSKNKSKIHFKKKVNLVQNYTMYECDPSK